METKEKLEVDLDKEEMAAFIVQGVVAARDDISVNTQFTIEFKYGTDGNGYDGPGRPSDVVSGAKIVFTR